jgi:cytochrome c-type biogenesis protein CcmH/NrfG
MQLYWVGTLYINKYNSCKLEIMKTRSKFIVSMVFVAIFCIIVNGNTKVVAAGNTWVSKGDALNRMGNFSQAIAAYDTALKIDPNNKQAWVSKGDALNRMGNFSQAIAAYDTALKIDPK